MLLRMKFVTWWIVAGIVADGAAALAALALQAVSLEKVLIVAGIEGILAGAFQCLLLRGRSGRLEQIWLVPTVLGALLGRMLEYECDVSPVAAAIADWGLAAHWAIGMLVGASVGAVLALPQAAAMRTRVRGSWRWIVVRAVAWGVALPLLLLIGAVWSHAGPSATPWSATAAIFVVLVALVGLIEGWAMARLTASPASGVA